MSDTDEEVLQRLTRFRQYRHNGDRVPHKPLLVLLALGRLRETGSSELSWSIAEDRLAELITEFGPATRTGRAQSAAYPFTRLRADGIWTLDSDVPDDRLASLRADDVTGHLNADLEAALKRSPALLLKAARRLVDSQFPPTVAPDVLAAVGLDPDLAATPDAEVVDLVRSRRRDPRWRELILTAWDRQCAFCGYDGQLAGVAVGIEAAHVRWFNIEGPDAQDNGLALCSLDHKLFDRGALGLHGDHRIQVSALFSARTEAAKRIYDLHERPLTPRRGTLLPAAEYVAWHTSQVFKGTALAS